MRVSLRDVSKGLALPTASVDYASGQSVVVVAETEQRPTVLGLIASGRMRSATGLVLIDGQEDASALRRRIALVDAPGVSDPAPDVTVAGVTAEELMFAGRTANPLAVRRWLDRAGYAALARVPIGDVSPRERIGLLLELTALRDDVEGIVLVSPDRHGGDPLEWKQLADAFAARGLAVLVIAGEAAASLLRLHPAAIPEPVPAPVEPGGGAAPPFGIQSAQEQTPATRQGSRGLRDPETESRTGEAGTDAEERAERGHAGTDAGAQAGTPAGAQAQPAEPTGAGEQE
jgi:hypothetical protein